MPNRHLIGSRVGAQHENIDWKKRVQVKIGKDSAETAKQIG
jgi:hypothetical protein